MRHPALTRRRRMAGVTFTSQRAKKFARYRRVAGQPPQQLSAALRRDRENTHQPVAL